MDLNWEQIESIAKAIVVIGGTLVALFQLYNRLPKSQAPLMRDLEILKMLDQDDPAYKAVRDQFDRRVAEIYNSSPTSAPKIRVYSWTHLALGAVFLSIFGVWTYSLYQDGSWWAVLTGFLAFGGAGNLLMAFEEKVSEKERPVAGEA